VPPTWPADRTPRSRRGLRRRRDPGSRRRRGRRRTTRRATRPDRSADRGRESARIGGSWVRIPFGVKQDEGIVLGAAPPQKGRGEAPADFVHGKVLTGALGRLDVVVPDHLRRGNGIF